MRGRWSRGIGPAVTVALALAAAGCGLGDRARDADAIVDATEQAFASGAARGTIAVTFEIESVPEGMGSVAGAAVGGGDQAAAAVLGQGSPPITAEFAFDFEAEHASLTIPGKERPFAVFDGLRSYGWRYNATDRDARPWVLLDLEDLEEGSNELSITEDTPSIGAFALNPIVLFDLAAGPLAGSIERDGSGDYAANFDIEKVLRDTRESRYDEDRRDAIDETLRALTVDGNIHEGEVTLAADGTTRRFRIRLGEEPVRRFELDLIVEFEVDELGGAVAIDVPTPREVVEVDNVVQFLRSVIPGPGTPELASFLGLDAPTTEPAPE